VWENVDVFARRGSNRGRRRRRRGGVSRGQSLGIGFVHGLAGPSGILAVLPAVVLEDAARSMAYLVAFFVASTACMVSFAAAFGAASDSATRAGFGDGARHSDTPARVAMALHLFAGCASIAIGTAWVALSSLGRLGDL